MNIVNKKKIKSGDILFIIKNEINETNKKLGKLRVKIGEKLKITKKKEWKSLWIVDFPLFKKKKNGKLYCTNHLFTAPKNKDFLNSKKIENLISNSYDMIINGYEIGGGSVRINNAKIQKKIFDIIGMKKSIQKKTFGFFTEALKYGTPPHAGIAFGLDRITMLLTKSKNIREVIAFPKTTNAICLVSDAPTKL